MDSSSRTQYSLMFSEVFSTWMGLGVAVREGIGLFALDVNGVKPLMSVQPLLRRFLVSYQDQGGVVIQSGGWWF